MAIHRNTLPQLTGKLFLTDGGLETTMIFHHGIELPEFAAFDLLSHSEGCRKLLEYYHSYAGLAHDNGLGFILESVSWRAGPDWVARVGYPDEAVEKLCRDSVEFVLPVRDKYQSDDTPMVISGQLGPRGDGYAVESAMTADESQEYHARQVRALAATEADMISALTLNYTAEAIGIARAASELGMPSVISFTVETDGCLPTGQPLAEAISEVDAQTDSSPAYYMINCAHTTHFEDTLVDAPWMRRIRGIRANASCLSHAELNDRADLDEGHPESFGHEHAALRERFPHINIFGGCCGTDIRHINAVVDSALRPGA
jgi:S-methylmethionine-dependent homocysteine/selenocysteine methylase